MMSKLFSLLFCILIALPATAQQGGGVAALNSLAQGPQKMTFKRLAGSTTKLLSVEIFRFVTAMSMVEMAKCFGFNGEMRQKLEMKGPGFMAGFDNPACMTQLGQMLRDPIFYAGFSMFIIGNHATASGLRAALNALDPARKHGASRVMEAQIIPQLAMAVGFMFDHVTNTLLHNPYVKACSADFFRSNREEPMVDLLNDPNQQQVVGTDAQGNEEVEVELNSNCQKMWLHLRSDQFLKEEMTVGLAGLAVTFGAMAGGSAALKGLLSIADLKSMRPVQVAAYYKQLAKQGLVTVLRGSSVGMGMLAGGPIIGGAIKGLAHMVVFLGIFEVINRTLILPLYHETWLKSNVKDKNEDLMRSYLGHRSLEEIEQEIAEVENTPIHQRSDNVHILLDEYEKAYNPQIDLDVDYQDVTQLRDKEICSKHYQGVRGEGLDPFCTRVPLIAELMTFGDYSATWRTKKVLADFMMAHGSWSLKLTSFFNRYFGSLQNLQLLTRSREMYLRDGRSGYIENIEENLKKEAINVLGELNGFDMQKAEQRFAEIDTEIVTYMVSEEEIPFPATEEDPEFLVYVILFQIYDYQFLMLQNKAGDIHKGLNVAQGEDPNQKRLELIDKVRQFLKGRYVNVENSSWKDEQLSYIPYFQDRLDQVEIPGLNNVFLQNSENLKQLANSEDPQEQALALRMFKSWAPYMYGTNPTGNYDDDPRFNYRGLEQEQYELWLELEEDLARFEPQYPYDPSFIEFYAFTEEDSTRARIENQRINTNEEDPLWKHRSHKLKTENINEFTLVALMCNEPEDTLTGLRGIFNRWFGERDGFSLHFPIPAVRHDAICEYLYQPMYATTYDKAPSPYHSIFAGEDRLYFGLHQAYIQAPKDHDHPFVFNRESDLEIWWNEDVVPKAEQSLRTMKSDFQLMIETKFAPQIRTGGDKGIVAGWNSIMKYFRSDKASEPDKKRLVTTKSLESSMQNELEHYRQALEKILDAKEMAVVSPHIDQLNSCIGELLDSILSKKFSEVAETCNSARNAVKTELTSSIPAIEVAAKEITTEAVLESDDPKGLIKAAQEQAVSDRIEELFEEIRGYDEMINNQFNFESIK